MGANAGGVCSLTLFAVRYVRYSLCSLFLTGAVFGVCWQEGELSAEDTEVLDRLIAEQPVELMKFIGTHLRTTNNVDPVEEARTLRDAHIQEFDRATGASS